MKRQYFIGAAAVLAVVLLTAGMLFLGHDRGSYHEDDGSYTHILPTDSFAYVEKHPAFADFADFIQPWKDTGNLLVTPRLSVKTVCAINHASTEAILDGFNFVIDQSAQQQIYYDFYTEEERHSDPTKEDTGLIFLPGDLDKPFILLTSGGAFKSVCLFLEGFPVAQELHELGYNVFVLKYRVNPNADTEKATMDHQERFANEDFGRAIQYIFDHHEELNVPTEDYAVCGFSAGGRTTFLWGLDNEYGYTHWGLPAPAAMLLIYSGWYDPQFDGAYGTVPPTYLAWLPEDDVIGADNVAGIRAYIDLLTEQGTTVEEHPYHEAKHGFGSGRGTDAEGWTAEAAAFWERQRAAG